MSPHSRVAKKLSAIALLKPAAAAGNPCLRQLGGFQAPDQPPTTPRGRQETRQCDYSGLFNTRCMVSPNLRSRRRHRTPVKHQFGKVNMPELPKDQPVSSEGGECFCVERRRACLTFPRHSSQRPRFRPFRRPWLGDGRLVPKGLPSPDCRRGVQHASALSMIAAPQPRGRCRSGGFRHVFLMVAARRFLRRRSFPRWGRLRSGARFMQGGRQPLKLPAAEPQFIQRKTTKRQDHLIKPLRGISDPISNTAPMVRPISMAFRSGRKFRTMA